MANISTYADEIDTTLKSVRKRPFDRYALGFFMMWYALKSKTMGKNVRAVLLSSGIYTIIYNLEEYKKLDNALQKGTVQDVLTVVLDTDFNTINEGLTL